MDKRTLLRFIGFLLDTEECWLWYGAKNAKGYGCFRKSKDRSMYYAHRIAYEYFVGEIPEGWVIDHLCENKSCVNPYHLEAVTVQVNSSRNGFGWGSKHTAPLPRAKRRSKDKCHRGHSLKGKNLYITPNGRRQCLACRRAAHKKWVAKQATT